MFDSQKELLDKIRLGESTFLEFKEVRFAGGRVSEPRRDALADELAAFANSRGGVFVLGVEDRTHEVVGIPVDRLDTVVDFVREVCIDSIEPAIEDIVLDRLWLPSSTGDEVAIVKVDIPRSLFVHRSPGGYFHRLADSKRRMSPEALARLFQQRSQTRIIYFDEQIVSSARPENLASALWERFRTLRSDDDREDFLGKLGMARADEDGTVKPTVAGVLMASEDPRRWLPNAYIQAVAYRGNRHQAGRTRRRLPIGRRRHHWPARPPGLRCLPLRGKEHEDGCFQRPGTPGPTPVRYDGGVRGCRQCRSAPRLFDLRLEDQTSPVRRPSRTLFSRYNPQHDDCRKPAVSAIGP